MKVGGRIGAIVLTGLFASGCAMGGYDPGALRSHLVSIGVSPAKAKCVVDGMTEKFGDNRLGGRADASALELKLQRSIVRRCGVPAVPAKRS